MPEKLHKELVKEAKAKGLKGEQFNRYVHGTMAKMGKQKAKSTVKRYMK